MSHGLPHQAVVNVNIGTHSISPMCKHLIFCVLINLTGNKGQTLTLIHGSPGKVTLVQLIYIGYFMLIRG